MAFTKLEDWSETAASNTEINGIVLSDSTQIDALDNIEREHMAQIAKWLGDDTLASATTTDLGSVPGRYVSVTGTTTITGLGTIKAGTIKYVKFTGVLTLTHNATSLILPGGASIGTAAGDTAVFVSEGSGNWRCVSFVRAATVPLTYADKSFQESGASTAHAVNPAVQQYHPSAAKAWARVTEDGAGNYTLAAAYNIASLTDNGTGNITVTFDVDFSSANYACVVSTNSSGVNAAATSLAAGSVVVRIFNMVPTAVDAGFHLVAFGDQ
jgi:hypothetical protein